MDGEGRADLPPGWAWATLGELGEVTGGLTKNAKRSTSLRQVPYLRVANVHRNRLDLTEVTNIGIADAELDRVLLAKGDLLIVEGNGSIEQVGRCAVWGGEIAGCVHQNHIIKVRPHHPSLSAWVLWWLASSAGRHQIEEVASSTSGLHTLSISKVAALRVPVAPLRELESVMAEMTAAFTELDEAEAALKRAREQLATYRASLLHAACTGALTAAWRTANPHPPEDGPALLRRILAERRAMWEQAERRRYEARGVSLRNEVWAVVKAKYAEPAQPMPDDLPALPENWTWATLDQLSGEPPRNGISVQGRLEPPGIAALRLDGLGPDGLRYDRCRYIDIPHHKAMALAIQSGDFLVSRANGSKHLVGRACVADSPPDMIVFPDTMIRFRLALPALCGWLAYVWQAQQTRSQFEQRAKSSAGIWKVGQDDLSTTAIPLPPICEINAIMTEASSLQLCEAGLPHPNMLADLKQSILHAAFTGRLVPQDPADEPATTLLARLRAAPAASRRPARPRPRAAQAAQAAETPP